MPDRSSEFAGTGLRVLLTAAALVVVVAGLDAAGQFILPILFSVFLSILALPGVNALKRVGVPNPLAIMIVVVVVALVLLAISGIIAGTIRGFTAAIPRYEEPFQELYANALALAERFGIANREDLGIDFKPTDVMPYVAQTLGAVAAISTQIVVVTITLTFILFEASELARKTEVALGGGNRTAARFAEASGKVQRYLAIKTAVSVVTGVLVGIWVLILGLDFPLLWGLLAFMLNYIPSVGSIIAAIPPMLLATVTLGWPYAIAVGCGYLVVNVLLGNFIEPRLLGRSLGLSPLVVFVSLLFWGWIWGPAGMLFSVPMTVIAKLVLEGSEDTRWIAVFLGSARDVREYEQRLRTKQAEEQRV